MALNKNAPGNAPATGMQKSVAPTKPFVNPSLAARGPFTPGYGTNEYAGPVSLPPGKTLTSALGDELKRAGDDGTLDQVIAHGAKGDDGNSQTRDIGDKGKVPTNPGTKGASKGATVPQKIGTAVGPLPKDPNA